MITYKELTCPVCNTGFRIRLAKYAYNMRNGQDVFCCSRQCTNRKDYIHSICEWCDKQFSRSNGGNRNRGRYCSRSCSAKAVSFSRRSVGQCKYCENEIPFGVTYKTVCPECRSGKTVSNRTLRVLRDAYSLSQYHAKIRGHARRTYELSKQPLVCKVCKYSLHVDICHIVDIKDFPVDTQIFEVNSIDNLVALCKNHHWEFDNNFLKI